VRAGSGFTFLALLRQRHRMVCCAAESF
jgi:hypothetical protein